MRRRPAYLAIAFGLTGCFHAAIETGAAPTDKVVTQNWAHGFLFGLVAPDVMSTAARCPNGVSKVETEHSFQNVLATVATLGLYTPITIAATCSVGPVKVPTETEDAARQNRNQGRGGQGGARRPGMGGRGGRRPPEN
jgi:hypothetical protein